jgi:hypothetical protein
MAAILYAQAWFEASNRGAIHASLLALYCWGGWLVSNGLMPLRVMVSGIGFTFSLLYATQVCKPLWAAAPLPFSLSRLTAASSAMLRSCGVASASKASACTLRI